MLHNPDSRAASLSFLAIIYHNTQGTRNGARKGAALGYVKSWLIGWVLWMALRGLER